MECIVFGFVIEIVITESMLEAGYHCFKIFDVIVLFSQSLILINQFFRIHKDIWYLFPHLTANLDRNHCIPFGLEQEFTLTTLKKTDIRNLHPKVYFVIDTREKVIELFNF